MTGGRGIGDLVARLPKTRAALAYAERRHPNQTRTIDGARFILHPCEVATLLYYAGADDRVIAAGVLHDTIEKTSVEAGELRAQFGTAITALVLAVSEDPRIPGYAARKAALRAQVSAAGHDALMVFAADKISKVRELRVESAPNRLRDASLSHQRRLTHHRDCLELLEDRLPDSPLVTQLRIELESATAIPHAPTTLARTA